MGVPWKGFTASYLAELTASLTVQILNEIGRKLRETISGTEKEQAIQRCLGMGLAALLATTHTESKEELDLLSGIFRKFFGKRMLAKNWAHYCEAIVICYWRIGKIASCVTFPATAKSSRGW